MVGIGADRGVKHDPANVAKAQATLKAFLAVLEAHFAGNTYLAWGGCGKRGGGGGITNTQQSVVFVASGPNTDHPHTHRVS
jgi:hypothetical protein